MSRRYLLAAALAPLLAACQGPSTNCATPCDTQPIADAIAPAGGAAAAAAAEGGLRNNANPYTADYGAANPVIVMGRGTGATESTSAYQADKTTSTGGTVNQAVVADALAQAQASALGSKPTSIVALENLLRQAQKDLAMYAPGSSEHATIEVRVNAILDRLNLAEAAWQERLASIQPPSHNFSGATIAQTVLSGAGGSPVNPENARAAASGVPATMRAAKGLAEPAISTTGVGVDPSPLPPAEPLPPAGPLAPAGGN